MIEGYEHLEIIQLVIFYNDNFGIDEGDPIDIRRSKFRVWLMVT